MFGFKRNKIKLAIKFHKDSAGLPEHGQLLAEHPDHDLRGQPVRFSFVDVATPPQLDRALFNYICDKAEAAGYVVRGLRSYATVVASVYSQKTQRQAVAESANAKAMRAHFEEMAKLNQVYKGPIKPSAPSMSVKDAAEMLVDIGNNAAAMLRQGQAEEVLDMSGLVGGVPAKGMSYDEFKATAPN